MNASAGELIRLPGEARSRRVKDVCGYDAGRHYCVTHDDLLNDAGAHDGRQPLHSTATCKVIWLCYYHGPEVPY